MYRVMIVDDEEPVLDSFSFILKKSNIGFELCGTARSGSEAILLMSEVNPDVVFMDIQMPGLNGIDTIDQAKHRHPNTVFILATAYERFDIARKAIPLGVFSYLVKPVSRKKFLDELEKVRQHLDLNRKQNFSRLEEIELLNKTKNDKKNRFLSSLVWKSPTENEWSEFTKLFQITANGGAIYLAGCTAPVPDNVKEEIYTEVAKKIQYKFATFSAPVNDKRLLFFPEDPDLKGLESKMQQIAEDYYDRDLVIGAGSVRHFNELNVSFDEAYAPFVQLEDETGRTAFSHMQEFCRTLLKTGQTRGEELFKQYWLEQFSRFAFQVAQGKMVSLFTLLLNELSHFTLTAGGRSFSPAEEIMLLENLEEWEGWAEVAMGRIYSMFDYQNSHGFPEPLQKALLYIEEHFSEPIQLSSAADAVGVTPSYLSRLFSEDLGTKFVDYLNRYRLDKAMILLKEKRISIKETSYQVGYQDPNYFSRIFRKHMGVSPSYLEKRGKEND